MPPSVGQQRQKQDQDRVGAEHPHATFLFAASLPWPSFALFATFAVKTLSGKRAGLGEGVVEAGEAFGAPQDLHRLKQRRRDAPARDRHP